MNTKAQNLGRALLGIALVIVIFSAGFYFSGPKPTVSGNVVKITGMETLGTQKESSFLVYGDLHYLTIDEKKTLFYIRNNELWIEDTALFGLGLDSRVGKVKNDGSIEITDPTTVKRWGNGLINLLPGSTFKNGQIQSAGATSPAAETGIGTAPLTQSGAIAPTQTEITKSKTIVTTDILGIPDFALKVLEPQEPLQQAAAAQQAEQKEPLKTDYKAVVVNNQKVYVVWNTETQEAMKVSTEAQAKQQLTNWQAREVFIKEVPTVIGLTDTKGSTYDIKTQTLTLQDKSSVTKKADGSWALKNEQNLPIKELYGNTLKEYSYKEGTKDLEAVRYTSPKGYLDIKGDTYTAISTKYQDKTNLFVQAAMDAGAKKITEKDYNTETGAVTVRGTTIKQDADGNVMSYAGTGDRTKVSIYQKDNVVKTYKGDVLDLTTGKIKDASALSSIEYTLTEKGVGGRVEKITSNEKQKDGNFKPTTTEWGYNQDGTIKSMAIEADDKTSTYTFMHDEKEGHNFYQKDGTQNYYDSNNGLWYTRNAKGEYEKCGEECDNDELKDEAKKLRSAIDAKAKEEGQPTISQKNWQRRFDEIEKSFTTFKGLKGFSPLFFSEDELTEWRETIDKLFASMYLGTDYWASDICSSSVEREGQGTAYIETLEGLITVGAHIEIERNEPLVYPNATKEYLYKITFKVNNPSYATEARKRKGIVFNVYLDGQRSISLFPKDIKVDDGGTFSKMGSSAIVQYSNYVYEGACIRFSEPILTAGRREVSEVCNKVGTVKKLKLKKELKKPVAGGGGEASADPGKEVDF